MMSNEAATTTAPTRRRKLVVSLRLISSVAAALMVGLSTGVIIHVNEDNLQHTLIREAQTQVLLEARNLALVSTDPLLSEFPELTLMPLAKDIMNSRPQLVNVVIINHLGTIVGSPEANLLGTSYVPPGAAAAITDNRTKPGEKMFMTGTDLVVSTPVRHANGSNLGTVVLTYDTRFIDRKVQAGRKASVKALLILLAGAMALAAFLMSLLFRPLSRVREGLERIGRGDLETPMAIRDITELGLLATTVNTMASQLKTSRALTHAREKEIVETQKEVVITLGQVVESRSLETANHTVRVGDMSHELALLAGLDPDEAELIRMASPMHDVGKIGIPDRILNKPGKLTDEEYRLIQTHAEIGHRILNKSQRTILKAAAIIAHQHHEKWDGTGYPRGIEGEDIHIYGRIVALVDVFDAISCDRVYRQAMPLDKVLDIIKSERGKHFDPRLVDIFLANLNRFLSIRDRYQDSMNDLVEAIPEYVALEQEKSPV